MPLSSNRKENAVGCWARRILLGWLFAVTLEYLIVNAPSLADLSGIALMSLPRVLIITAICAVFQCLFLKGKTGERISRWSFVALFSILSITALFSSFTWAFFAICLLIEGILTIYALRGWNYCSENIVFTSQKAKWQIWVTAGAAVLLFLFISAWTVCRIWTFSTPSFDFGLFAQMFHYMKKIGQPLTTLERDGLLSHFAVHVSPIYYLMLPFYALVPRPETLQVLQAAVVVSAVIPLWKIGKQHRLNSTECMLLCGILLLFPALSGGTSYDLHENCFLTPLLLWLFYFLEKKNWPLTAIFALLTLGVKEDAAVYVAVIGLWLGVKSLLQGRRGELLAGIFLLLGSLLWFFAVTAYLAKYGDGVMTYRYRNFMYDGSSSLITVVKAVLMNPMKAFYECVDAEKLEFIALTMLPLLGLPLLTRRFERYLLLIPYILINLMSDYTYQHSIFFQYCFGATAFLLYLTAVNLGDLRKSSIRIGVLFAAFFVSFGCFCSNIIPKATGYIQQNQTYSDYYQSVRKVLDTIPEDASVTTATFYSTYLSDRDIVYDLRYTTKEHLLETEYVVLKVSTTGDFKKYAVNDENGYENLIAFLQENGYVLYAQKDGVVEIYKKT